MTDVNLLAQTTQQTPEWRHLHFDFLMRKSTYSENVTFTEIPKLLQKQNSFEFHK